MAFASLPPDEIRNRFGYHRANDVTAPQHAEIRALYLQLALALNARTPEGRDKSLALTELQSSMHWANSAVAMQTPVDDDPAVPTP